MVNSFIDLHSSVMNFKLSSANENKLVVFERYGINTSSHQPGVQVLGR
jgi:hypothetical protein